MKKIFFLILAIFLLATPALAYTTWPAGSASDITAGINSYYYSLYGVSSGFEPSGASYHSSRGTYLINGDDGDLFEIDLSGNTKNYWWIGGDLEGIALIDSGSSVIYLLDESTSSIFGYDLDKKTKNSQSWNFYGHDESLGLLNGDAGDGVEGLTWIPDGFHPFGTTTMGGVFAVGYQHDGDIYFYEPKTSTTYNFLYELHTDNGFTDNAALDFDQNTGKMFAVYDGYDTMEEWNCSTSGFSLNKTYSLSDTYAQEGIAFRDDCSSGLAEVLIADDGHNTGGVGHVYLYENFPITCLVVDADSDGYDSSVDCRDDDPSINPGITEVPYDGIDQDCSGADLIDADGDGYDYTVDCRDSDVSVYPGATEVAYDDIDQDCNGFDLTDVDGDGYDYPIDCRDDNTSINPGVAEIPYDGIDQDCSGADLTDVDSDGYDFSSDCRDTDASIHPGAAEIPYDGIDQDCSGFDLVDVDGDGFGYRKDCNDTDAAVHVLLKYYLDADGDGLGLYTSSTTVCSSTPPVGYVNNFSDTNDSIPNAGVEIFGDKRDNDGDGRKDEFNTLFENEAHPYFSTLDPKDITLFGKEILSFSSSAANGMAIQYRDNSFYSYQLYSSSSALKPTVQNLKNTAFFGAYRGLEAALINGLTGQIVATTILSKPSLAALLLWVTGLGY